MGCEVTDLRYYLKTGTLNKGLHDPIDILYGAVFSTLSDITIPKGIKRPFNVKKRNNNDVKNYAANNFKKSHASKAGKRELLTEGAILGQYIYCCRGTFEYAPEYVALHLDITVAKLKRLESAKISAVSKDLLDRTCRLFKCKPEHIQIFGDKLKKGDLRWRYNPN